MKILWIGTNYYPSPGGAATYFKLLGEAADARQSIEKLIFLVESYPGQDNISVGSNKRLEVRRIFPFRGGAAKKGFVAYAKYGLQNLALLRVPAMAKQLDIDLVVVHSWYFIHPSVISYVVNRLKAQGIKLVADMRDTALKTEQFKQLHPFDALIGCGLRVIRHFQSDEMLTNKFHHIPVPIEKVEIEDGQVDETLLRFDLQKFGFVFLPTGVANDKRFPLVFDAWQQLLNEGRKIDLVVAGRNRDWRERYGKTRDNGRLILTGSLDKAAIHSLYSTAALSLNASKFEGMPRTPIEAVGHGRPLLFPPNTPEFADFSDEYICNTDNPAELMLQMKNAIDLATLGIDFDLSQHSPKNVANKTFALFDALINKVK